MNKSEPPVITIDGPSGSGKGTVSQIVARCLGWRFLDSGALYRLLALAAERHAVDAGQEGALATLAAHLDVEFASGEAGGEARVLLEGEDVTQAMRSEACGNAASRLAALPAVREALLERQRAFRRPPGLVADGRDMGTVVFPEAGLKIFLTASAGERAKRRYKQLKEKGMDVNLPRILDEIASRDERDSRRAVAPMRPAQDAVVLDTTTLAIDGVVQRVLDLCRERHISEA